MTLIDMDRTAPSSPKRIARKIAVSYSSAAPQEATRAARQANWRPRAGANRAVLKASPLGLLGPKGGIWGSQPSRRRRKLSDR
ncbi:MAG: hypothetical protein JWO02_1732 [Solirubrobacterales bacterium]|nr:hypothetical protein [Solirubrobacterales bacterium]